MTCQPNQHGSINVASRETLSDGKVKKRDIKMDSNTALYLDIEAVLRKEILALPPNSTFPTEIQLAKRFLVSRVTIRRALEMLENSGLVTRQRGRGIITNPPKVVRRFYPLYSFEHDLRDRGIKFETVILARKTQEAPDENIRSRLQIDEGTTVGFLSLIRLVNDRIICHDKRYYRTGIVEYISDEIITSGNLSLAVRKVVGKGVESTDWESEIVPASKDAANALRIAPGVLVVANSFNYYLSDGTPIETGEMYYRVDRCKFQFGGMFKEPIGERNLGYGNEEI